MSHKFNLLIALWLKSYDCLGQGEKIQVDIAKALRLNKNRIVFNVFIGIVKERAKVSA